MLGWRRHKLESSCPIRFLNKLVIVILIFWPENANPLLTVMGWLHRAAAEAAKSLQLCPTLCDPIDGSSPGSPVPGILQEWVAISFSNA